MVILLLAPTPAEKVSHYQRHYQAGSPETWIQFPIPLQPLRKSLRVNVDVSQVHLYHARQGWLLPGNQSQLVLVIGAIET